MHSGQKKKKNIILRIAFATFAVYAVIQVVSIRIQIHQKQEELIALDAQIHKQEVLNESAQDMVDNLDTHLAEEAHDQGYYWPGEQIYKVIPEN